MDTHSPLDYSRDRTVDRSSHNKRLEQPPENKPSSLRSHIVDIRNRPARQVFNPKLELKAGPSIAVKDRNSIETADHSPEIARSGKRKQRNIEQVNAIGLQLRTEERKLLVEVGKFRVIAVADLARTLYGGEDGRLNRDLGYLRQNRLVDVHAISARRDGRSENIRTFDAVTLTKAARKLVERNGDIHQSQRVYSGLVKPREAEHDSQIYRAYLKELSKIEGDGGKNPRVKLDFELKSIVQRALYQARKAAAPERDLSGMRNEIAEQFNLCVVDNKIVIPDARIEYDLPSGGTGQTDIEVATSAYRHGDLAGKARAGFRMYMPKGDIGRLGPAVQDDHDIMSEIMDF